MSEEQIEKTPEKYFYIDKERTYKVLTSIATSFIGAGLALALFGWVSRPPIPPCRCGCPIQIERPCPMMQHNDRRPPKYRKHHDADRHQGFREESRRNPNPEIGRHPQNEPTKPHKAPTPDKAKK